MTDDPPFGTLPRFSRDITILSGRLWNRERTTGFGSHGVLPPFSGVLDVRFERGRVPMLDLSYLSLESIVAQGLARPDRDRVDHTTGESREVHHHTGSTESSDPGGGLDDRPELTVRELLAARREPHDGDAEGESLGDRLDTGQSLDRTPTERPDTERQTGADLLDGPSFTTVDHSRPTRPTDGPEPSEPRARRGQTESPSGVHGRVDTGHGMSSDFALEQTVVDRSPTSVEGGEQPGEVPARPPSEGAVRTGSGPIAPPRMVPDRREAGRTSGPTREASVGPGSPPRESHDGQRGESTSAQSLDTDEQLSAVVDASTDPESTLVDRLYRTLQEREAIERRRRGER